MNKLFFVDIDTQRDFMLPTGALYVPGAERIRSKLRRLFDFAKNNNVHVLSSVDAHSPEDPEFGQFPPHCVRGTEGQQKLEETLLPHRLVLENRVHDRNLVEDVRKYSQIILEKQDFDVFSNPMTEKLLKALPPRAVVFGVATEYCVRAACLGLRRNNVQTVMISDAVRPLSARTEEEALNVLRRAGVESIPLDALLDSVSN